MVCEQKWCPSTHVGKFDSCLTQAIWHLSIDRYDEQAGSTEYRNHFALVIVRETEKVSLYHQVVVAVPPGFYIVESNDQGQIWVYQRSSEENARHLIADEDRLYAEWLSYDGE